MEPRIIQAGMGIGVSNWVLANAVAAAGQIGVVSGTALDSVLIRRLQDGDSGEHIRYAMSHYPDSEYVANVLKKYFSCEGRVRDHKYNSLSMLTANSSLERMKLVMLANFVEVFLAKRGHKGKVGINFLEKVKLPILPSLYGALLAGVDYVFMGAGIPREVPSVLDKLALHQDVEYKLAVSGATAADDYKLHFSPRLALGDSKLPDLLRPKFFAIVSSTVLAMTLSKKVSPPVDGFVIEMPTAGGHNAPPRGALQLNARGEPIYGTKDDVDLRAIADLNLPFWLAGSRGSPQGLRDSIEVGAAGIQVGTAFALCDESGLDRALKNRIIEQVLLNKLDVFTDPVASPTGFPFKIAHVAETASESEIYNARERVCNLGYLRELYKKDDGAIGYRCSAEQVDQYVEKGGALEHTVGKKCLCNGLMATIGLGQVTSSGVERPLVTIGDDVRNIAQFMRKGLSTFSALDVISFIMEGMSTREREVVFL